MGCGSDLASWRREPLSARVSSCSFPGPVPHEDSKPPTDIVSYSVGTWFAFKRVFRRKAEKMERTNLTYGAMAKLCRDGGFWVRFMRLVFAPVCPKSHH